MEAGFPSPADDYVERTLDLNEEVITHPAATFFLRAGGRSMQGAGIHDGDLVVVERCDTASNVDIVVALVEEEEATLKRLRRQNGMIALEAANPLYETRLFREDQVTVQGRLVGLIRTY